MNVTLLLPARARLAADALPPSVAAALGRADVVQAANGEAAQVRRQFRWLPETATWPVAALTRQRDAGDAGNAIWLRADPAFVQPDLSGARMLAWGEMLAPDAQDVAQLLPALQPLFAGSGLVLDAPVPARWYLRVPHAMALPEFSSVDAVLGEDLYAHLPTGEAGRTWRALLTQTQVVLHNHPWNARRRATGKSAINSLWFWGAGRLPDSVQTIHTQIHSRDALLLALAQAAGITAADASTNTPETAPATASTLVDLRHLRAIRALADEALPPLLSALARRELAALHLDFADGAQYHLTARQRWRVWRRPVRRFPDGSTTPADTLQKHPD